MAVVIAKENNRKMEGQLDTVIVVKVSELSLQSKFMQHEPKSERQKSFKMELEQVLQQNISDIKVIYGWPMPEANTMWPLAGGNNIPFTTKLKKNDIISIEGCILKQLVEEANWEVEEAWHALCDDPNFTKLFTYFMELHMKKAFENDIWKLLFLYFGMPFVRKVTENPILQLLGYEDTKSYYTTVPWLVLD